MRSRRRSSPHPGSSTSTTTRSFWSTRGPCSRPTPQGRTAYIQADIRDPERHPDRAGHPRAAGLQPAGRAAAARAPAPDGTEPPEESSLTTADDHALAHDLAEQAGRLLLDLRAQGGDPDVLKDAGRPSSHEFLMAELAKATTRRRGPLRRGHRRQGPPHRRPSLDRRPPGRHARVRRAGPHRLGRPRSPLGARRRQRQCRRSRRAHRRRRSPPRPGHLTLSTLDAAQRPAEGPGLPERADRPLSAAPLRLVVSRTRASQLVKDVAAITRTPTSSPAAQPAPRPPR